MKQFYETCREREELDEVIKKNPELLEFGE
jgi:hypothetical protein